MGEREQAPFRLDLGQRTCEESSEPTIGFDLTPSAFNLDTVAFTENNAIGRIEEVAGLFPEAVKHSVHLDGTTGLATGAMPPVFVLG